MQNPEDILDPTTIIDMTLVLMAKAFTLNDTTPINNNQRSSSNPSNMQIAQPGMNMDQDRQMLMVENNVRNQFRPNAVQNVGNHVVQNAVQNSGVENVGNYNRLSVDPGIANQYGIRNVVTARAEANGNGINGNQIRCYTSRVDHYASNAQYKARKGEMCCFIFRKQTQLLKERWQGFNSLMRNLISSCCQDACEETERANANCTLENNLQQASTSGTQSDKAPVYDSANLFNPIVEQDGGTIYQHPSTVEETRAYFESLCNNLAIEVEKINTVNRKLRETNADLTTKLARYKNQEKCFEISQDKYDKLESSGKQITTLNEEISNLNNQLLKEKSTVSSLLEEKKRLKSDFKIREDKLLDKQIQLENKIKELDNILVKTAQQKQQSLYNGKFLLEKHDPPVVYDLEETLQLAQESRSKMK
ncbi:hypothetical protein Tco_1329718 [Tanacetum coccineum]